MDLITKYSELESQSSELKSAAQRMEDILSSTASILNGVGNVWQSEAGIQAVEMFNKLSGSFQKFIDAIIDRATTIDNIVAAHKNADQAAIGMAEQ